MNFRWKLQDFKNNSLKMRGCINKFSVRGNLSLNLHFNIIILRNFHYVRIGLSKLVDWLQSLKQLFINVSFDILVASLTLMALS